LSTSAALDVVGYHTTIPVASNVFNDDKLLALACDFGQQIPRLPTLRVSTRQAYPMHLQAYGLDFPVIVKPASWGGGNAVMRADDQAKLNAIIQLAGAGDVTMIVQPYVGAGARDVRVYCVEGEPEVALIRSAGGGSITANVGQGGTSQVAAVPPEVTGWARRISASIGLSYLGVDFLNLGGQYWLSEIEIDAGTVDHPELSRLRFRAYLNGFRRYLAAATHAGR
jgi:glutathione synthase/RimK-type ligase-like ATP-grasp enzyme